MEGINQHISELLPETAKYLLKLSENIAMTLLEIRERVESDNLKESRFEQESIFFKKRLQSDVKHRNWYAAKNDMTKEQHSQENALRLEIHELRFLHSRFLHLKKLMSQKSFRAAIDHDLIGKQKEEFEQIEHYYFLKLFQFCSTYEKIFRDLLQKEVKLSRQLKGELVTLLAHFKRH